MDYNHFFEKIKDIFPKIETNTASDLSESEFKTRYGYPEVPVLLKARFNELHQSIDFKELDEKFDSREWKFDSTTEQPGAEMSLKDYLQKETNEYYLKTNIRDIDFNIDYPDFFKCWYRAYPTEKEKKELVWLYYGNKNTFTNIHTDIWKFNSWLLLLKGKKLWFIYPKAYNAIIRENKEKYGIDHIETLMDGNIKPFIAVQNPGEMMYVPSDTFHFVINLEASMAYTGNFMNETNYENVKQYFAKSDNSNNKKFINSIIATGMTHLKIKNL